MYASFDEFKKKTTKKGKMKKKREHQMKKVQKLYK